MNGLDLLFIVSAFLGGLFVLSLLTRRDPEWRDPRDYRDRRP